MFENKYDNCRLCARLCKVDRRATSGFCKMSTAPVISRAALHHWEEPPISGTRGSGTIFFTGCSLGCIFCQNRHISSGEHGREVTEERLAEIMLELQAKGAHNINLVTPTHFVPTIKSAIDTARGRGLKLPIVYNTGSYDTEETIDSLDGYVNIYLPDFKYFLSRTAKKFSFAEDYPTVAKAAIDKMVGQVGAPKFDFDGIMQSGVIVRILLLPGHVAEAKLSLKYLLDTYGDKIYVSLMNQYTPMEGMEKPLDRRVSREEYKSLVEYADKIGLKNGFTQEFGTAKESFIPAFDLTGV